MRVISILHVRKGRVRRCLTHCDLAGASVAAAALLTNVAAQPAREHWCEEQPRNSPSVYHSVVLDGLLLMICPICASEGRAFGFLTGPSFGELSLVMSFGFAFGPPVSSSISRWGLAFPFNLLVRGTRLPL
jgi:hypothetical protein